jgi:hypothetical protein
MVRLVPRVGRVRPIERGAVSQTGLSSVRNRQCTILLDTFLTNADLGPLLLPSQVQYGKGPYGACRQAG